VDQKPPKIIDAEFTVVGERAATRRSLLDRLNEWYWSFGPWVGVAIILTGVANMATDGGLTRPFNQWLLAQLAEDAAGGRAVEARPWNTAAE